MGGPTSRTNQYVIVCLVTGTLKKKMRKFININNFNWLFIYTRVVVIHGASGHELPKHDHPDVLDKADKSWAEKEQFISRFKIRRHSAFHPVNVAISRNSAWKMPFLSYNLLIIIIII